MTATLPRPCAIPNCKIPACAVFRAGPKTDAMCPIHGYIVMRELKGMLIEIIDRRESDRMVSALRADGAVVAGYELLS
jgi:hypothetical protein